MLGFTSYIKCLPGGRLEGSQQEQQLCSASSCYHHCSRENKMKQIHKCTKSLVSGHRTNLGTPVPLPASATAFVCMLAEVQSGDFSLHHLLDLTLWDPSEAGKHCQEFTASQTLNQGIKLARSQGTNNNMR